jgi:hypothetical protein
MARRFGLSVIFKDKTRQEILIGITSNENFSEEFNRGSSQKLKNSAGDKRLVRVDERLSDSSERDGENHVCLYPIGDASPMPDISEF